MTERALPLPGMVCRKYTMCGYVQVLPVRRHWQSDSDFALGMTFTFR